MVGKTYWYLRFTRTGILFLETTMIGRLAAILIGIAVMFTLEAIVGFRWYWALLIAVAAYLLARYIVYFIAERRLIRDTIRAAPRRHYQETTLRPACWRRGRSLAFLAAF
jgi:hypothetical protein